MLRELHSSPSQPCRALETSSASQSWRKGQADLRCSGHLNPAALKEPRKKKRCISQSRFPWKHEPKTGIHIHLSCSVLPVWLMSVQGLPAHLHLEAVLPTWRPGPWGWSRLTTAHSTKSHWHNPFNPHSNKPTGQEERPKKE